MTAVSDHDPPLPVQVSPSVEFWPLFGWLAIQMIALAVAALRVPLSARYAAPAEALAVHVMVVVQTAASAMLFPLLFRTVANFVLSAGAAVLFLQIAGFLAARVDARLAWCAGYVVVWMAGLAVWAGILRSHRARMYGVAAFAMLTIGGVVVAYLGREFGAPTREFDWAARGWLGPTIGGLAILETGPSGRIWFFLGAFWLCSVVGWAWFGRWRRLQG